MFRQLSVEDNLMATLETRKNLTRKQRKDRQNELLDQFGLTTVRKTKANRVSGGERRRVEITPLTRHRTEDDHAGRTVRRHRSQDGFRDSGPDPRWSSGTTSAFS